MRKVEHIATKNIYYVLNDNVLNATNRDSGKRLILYVGKEKTSGELALFAREYDEFMKRFKFINDPSLLTQKFKIVDNDGKTIDILKELF